MTWFPGKDPIPGDAQSVDQIELVIVPRSRDIGPFAVGFVVSFVFALIAVKALIRYVASHDFNAFAWYRIALGAVVLWYFTR